MRKCKKDKLYVRRATGREWSHAPIIMLSLCAHAVDRTPYYVLVARGEPNYALDVAHAKQVLVRRQRYAVDYPYATVHRLSTLHTEQLERAIRQLRPRIPPVTFAAGNTDADGQQPNEAVKNDYIKCDNGSRIAVAASNPNGMRA